MEMGVIILMLVGVVALLSYKRGKQAKENEVLRDEVESNKERRRISNLSDSELDDELYKHWK
jgi:hypothetical protein